MVAWIHEGEWCEITVCLYIVLQGGPSIWNSGESARFMLFRGLSCPVIGSVGDRIYCCHFVHLPTLRRFPWQLCQWKEDIKSLHGLNKKSSDPCLPQEGNCQSECLSQWCYKHVECMQVIFVKQGSILSAWLWCHSPHLQKVFFLIGVLWQKNKWCIQNIHTATNVLYVQGLEGNSLWCKMAFSVTFYLLYFPFPPCWQPCWEHLLLA